MTRDASKHDPFAGYTPVKVAIPVVDIPDAPPDENHSRGRKYKFGGKGEAGDALRTAILAITLVLSVLAILAVAAFTYGVIYDKPINDEANGLRECTERIKPLVDAGRDIRERVISRATAHAPFAAAVTSTGSTRTTSSPICKEVQRLNLCEKLSEMDEVAYEHDEGTECAEKAEIQPDASPAPDVSPATDVAAAPDAAANSNAAAVGKIPREPARKRTIDPRLKEFYNGGRKGRSIGDGKRRK